MNLDICVVLITKEGAKLVLGELDGAFDVVGVIEGTYDGLSDGFCDGN